jgi:hypothetical protein
MHLRKTLSAVLASAVLLRPALLPAEPVAVRHAEGLVHGFLSLSTLEGAILASGDLIQVARGDRVTTRLVFHFKDGSIHDETAVFSQRTRFRLVSDHVVQKGPAFERPMDMTIDTASGQVNVRYTDKDGKEKTEAERLKLPTDVANGLVTTLLKNIRPNAGPAAVSFVAATPKPRLVKLSIAVAGADSFTIAGSPRKATHYVLKVDIGGLTGALASFLGKQPPDSHVWILEGEAPAFVRSEAPLFTGGPVWRIDLVSPVWPRGR